MSVQLAPEVGFSVHVRTYVNRKADAVTRRNRCADMTKLKRSAANDSAALDNELVDSGAAFLLYH